MKLKAVVVHVETTPHIHKIRLLDVDSGEFDGILWKTPIPAKSQTVELQGTWKEWHGEQQFHIDTWRRILNPEECGSLHELLCYASKYLKKEAAASLEFNARQRGKTHLLSEEGPVQKTNLQKIQNGPFEEGQTIWVGWPVVNIKRQYLPLFITEASESNLNQWHLNQRGLYAINRGELIEDITRLLKENKWNDLLDLLAKENIAVLGPNLGPYKSDQLCCNTQIIFTNNTGIYRTLEQDLQALCSIPEKELFETPLRYLLQSAQPKELNQDVPPLVLPANRYQSRAIEASTMRDWTVVTGPPGTGKTQVVINMIAGALIRKERVLVLSKNNLAVDLVLKRIKSLSINSFPMRTGNRTQREELLPDLQRLLTIIAAPPRESTEVYYTKEELEPILAEHHALEQRKRSLNTKIAKLRKHQPDAPKHKDHKELLQKIRAIDQRQNRLRQSSLSRKALLQKLASIQADYQTLKQKLGQEVTPQNLDKIKQQIKNDFIQHELQKILHTLEQESKSLPSSTDLRHKGLLLSEAWRDLSLSRLEHRWHELLYELGSIDRIKLSELLQALEKKSPIQDKIEPLLDSIPLWGSTLLSARSSFPLKPQIFDLVIIDEASQADLISSIPLLYRASRVAIIGDPMQLRPISALTAEQDLLIKQNLNLNAFKDLSLSKNSLFDAAATYNKPLLLAEHYRCPQPLAQMISEMFYEGRLKIRSTVSDDDSFVFLELKGSWSRNNHGVINTQEAQAIVDLVQQNPTWISESLGIVTPFRAQADLIKSMLQTSVSEHAKILVDTTHRFQGEERDNMLLSLTVNQTAPASLISFVATENLINVALSRARRRLWVVADPNLAQSHPLFQKLFSYLEARTNRAPEP